MVFNGFLIEIVRHAGEYIQYIDVSVYVLDGIFATSIIRNAPYVHPFIEVETNKRTTAPQGKKIAQ